MGLGSRIRKKSIPDPGSGSRVKKATDPGSGSATLATVMYLLSVVKELPMRLIRAISYENLPIRGFSARTTFLVAERSFWLALNPPMRGFSVRRKTLTAEDCWLAYNLLIRASLPGENPWQQKTAHWLTTYLYKASLPEWQLAAEGLSEIDLEPIPR
jgi:hypothetical protein